MKKTLVLASLLAAFGAASAQTSVTVGGTTSFGYQRDGATSSLRETDMTVVFKGKEELGGGLSAAFSVEFDNSNASFRQLNGSTMTLTDSNGDTTTVAKDNQGVRRKNTSLALSGGFGTVTLASTRGSELAVMALVAPTNLNTDYYSASATGVFGRPNIDLLGYSLPMGPLTLGASYTESGAGEGSGDNNTTGTNRTATLSARYTAGAVTVAGAFKNTSGPSTVAQNRKSNYELGATLDLGAAVVGAGFDSKPIDGTSAAYSFGVKVPMGASSFGLNYGKRDTASLVEVGFQHNLSARTNVNLSAGRYGVTGATTGQYRVSLNHAF